MNETTWDNTKQERLTTLRLRKLSNALTSAESAELDQLMDEILQDDTQIMSQTLTDMQQEIETLQSQLEHQQTHNAAVAPK